MLMLTAATVGISILSIGGKLHLSSVRQGFDPCLQTLGFLVQGIGSADSPGKENRHSSFTITGTEMMVKTKSRSY
jgi:hypothetical protein